jgi:predicted GTPase
MEDKTVVEELKRVPLQLAIAGRPNVGKSTLLNALVCQERVLTGPEPGLTRDSIRVQFDYDGQTVYLVSKLPFAFFYVLWCPGIPSSTRLLIPPAKVA